MTVICPSPVGQRSAAVAAAIAMPARVPAGASDRAIVHTASATTATATTLRPWSQPASATPSERTP